MTHGARSLAASKNYSIYEISSHMQSKIHSGSSAQSKRFLLF